MNRGDEVIRLADRVSPLGDLVIPAQAHGLVVGKAQDGLWQVFYDLRPFNLMPSIYLQKLLRAQGMEPMPRTTMLVSDPPAMLRQIEPIGFDAPFYDAATRATGFVASVRDMADNA